MPKINLGKVVGDKGDSFTFDDFTPEQLDGITPKLLKGNVTTLDPDENVTIDIRKDGVNNYIDFGIPRGKNGAEIKKVSASNVELEEDNTLDAPIYDDTVGTYTSLFTANEAAETSTNKIKSGLGLLATLSNAKKSLSAIVQGLKILGTNVGAINGITSDINSESTTIAASSKMVHDLNASLNGKFATVTGVFGDTLNIGTIIRYPSNFTRQNTVVIAQHYGESTSLRDQFYGSELAMTTTLRIDGIEVTPRNSILFGHSFKIVLMKI